MHQENNTIVNNAVDEILLNKRQKLIAPNNEAPEFLDSDYDANYLCEVENMSLEDTKEKIDWRKRVFEYKKKIHMGLKIEMI